MSYLGDPTIVGGLIPGTITTTGTAPVPGWTSGTPQTAVPSFDPYAEMNRLTQFIQQLQLRLDNAHSEIGRLHEELRRVKDTRNWLGVPAEPTDSIGT